MDTDKNPVSSEEKQIKDIVAQAQDVRKLEKDMKGYENRGVLSLSHHLPGAPDKDHGKVNKDLQSISAEVDRLKRNAILRTAEIVKTLPQNKQDVAREYVQQEINSDPKKDGREQKELGTVERDRYKNFGESFGSKFMKSSTPAPEKDLEKEPTKNPATKKSSPDKAPEERPSWKDFGSSFNSKFTKPEPGKTEEPQKEKTEPPSKFMTKGE